MSLSAGKRTNKFTFQRTLLSKKKQEIRIWITQNEKNKKEEEKEEEYNIEGEEEEEKERKMTINAPLTASLERFNFPSSGGKLCLPLIHKVPLLPACISPSPSLCPFLASAAAQVSNLLCLKVGISAVEEN